MAPALLWTLPRRLSDRHRAHLVNPRGGGSQLTSGPVNPYPPPPGLDTGTAFGGETGWPRSVHSTPARLLTSVLKVFRALRHVHAMRYAILDRLVGSREA